MQAEVLPMYLGPPSTEHTQAVHCNILFNRTLHMQRRSLKIPKELRDSSDLETCSHGNTVVQCIIQGLMVMLVSTNLWLCLTCKSIAWQSWTALTEGLGMSLNIYATGVRIHVYCA